MTEEAKYYTPEIEEFHVGFEFEMDDTWGGWKKLVLTDEMLKGNVMIGLGSGNERVPYYHKTRVKYLDREDIESLEFKFDGIMYCSVCGNFRISVILGLIFPNIFFELFIFCSDTLSWTPFFYKAKRACFLVIPII